MVKHSVFNAWWVSFRVMLPFLQVIFRQRNLFGRNIVVYATGVSQGATSKMFITLSRFFLTSPTLVIVRGCGIAVRSFVNQSTRVLTILYQLVQIITVNSCCLCQLSSLVSFCSTTSAMNVSHEYNLLCLPANHQPQSSLLSFPMSRFLMTAHPSYASLHPRTVSSSPSHFGLLSNSPGHPYSL